MLDRLKQDLIHSDEAYKLIRKACFDHIAKIDDGEIYEETRCAYNVLATLDECIQKIEQKISEYK